MIDQDKLILCLTLIDLIYLCIRLNEINRVNWSWKS